MLSTPVFKCLETIPHFDALSLHSTMLTCLWGAVTAASECRAAFVITADNRMASYRRWGLSAQYLNTTTVVSFTPEDDPLSTLHAYVPDPVTGQPMYNGRWTKVCTIGLNCPAVPDPAQYAAFIQVPQLFPAWVVGQYLPHGEPALTMSLGMGGLDQPVLNLGRALRSPSSGDIMGVLSIVYQGSTVKQHLESILVVSELGGIMFITASTQLRIFSSTHGSILVPPTPTMPGGDLLPATQSDHAIVRETARRMNNTYRDDLFVRPIELVAHISGHGRYFLSSQPVTHLGLRLIIFLTVPVSAFRGDIDAARDKSIRVTALAAVGVFVAGMIGIILSTMIMSKSFRQITKQNDMLRLKLQMTGQGDDLGWSMVDMGTASEKLHAMIRTLQAGRALTQQQVTQMQELINVDDMHKPQFLRTLQDHGNTEAIVDKETGSWLFSLINVGASSRSMFATKFRKQGQRHRVSRDGSESTSSTTDTRDMSTHQAVMGSKASEDEDDVSEHIIDVEALLAVGNQARGAPRVPEDLEAGESADVGGGGRGLGGGGGGSGGPVYFSTLLSSMVTLQDMSLEEEPVGAPAPDLAAGGALAQQLAKLGSWELDALKLADVSSGRPILFVGYTALHTCRLMHEFALPKDKLVRFLLALEQGMPPHAMYHSAAHIADVAGSLYHLLRESGVSQHLRRIDELAAMCAALMHDYKHPGVNNDYIQRTGGELSYRYNDVSILENYHLSEAFNLLRDDKCHFLKHLGTTEFADIRHSIIEMVLATDLKRHFALLDAFKSRLLNLQDKPWDKDSETDRLLLLRMAIKIADLGHACKPLAMHKVWTGLIVEEFYVQGDLERSAQMPISPFMDRNNNNVPKAQHGFIHFLVFPLVEAWVKAFPKSAPLLANLIENFEFWKNEQMNEITRSPRSR
eukprot:jgi/Mesvir1/29053/Mv18357-RA.2